MSTPHILSEHALQSQIRVTDLDFEGESRIPGFGSRDAIVAAARTWALQGTGVTLTSFEHRGRRVFRVPELEQRLVVRALATEILARLPRKPASRVELTAALHTFLSATQQMTVVRLDVQNFFGSVDSEALAGQVADAYLKDSQTSVALLKRVVGEMASICAGGLAPGVPVSNALAEASLVDLDRRMRQHPDVCFYGRFVDDIVLVLPRGCDAAGVIAEVGRLLPPNAVLHGVAKRTVLEVPEVPKKASKEALARKPFEFLGYRFEVGHGLQESAGGAQGAIVTLGRDVNVELAERKVRRTKERIVHALTSHRQRADFSLLEKRIRFLSCLPSIDDPRVGRSQRIGIRRTHPLLRYGERNSLRALDMFWHQAITRNRDGFSREQRAKLRRFSFVCGFDSRIMFRTTPTELRSVMECWRHV